MTEETPMQRAMPLAEGIEALPEHEFLAFDRDTHRRNARHEFTAASIGALAAAGMGIIGGVSALTGVGPVSILAAVPAAIFVASAIRHGGKGIQEAADSVSADTTLRLAYEHEGMKPGHRIRETETHGPIAPGPAVAVHAAR